MTKNDRRVDLPESGLKGMRLSFFIFILPLITFLVLTGCGGSSGGGGGTTTPPSFSLSASAVSVSVVQGGNNTVTISVIGANGFSGAVTLAASGLPSGATAAFTTNPTSGSSVVTFTATNSATVGGPVTVTVSGTSGTLTASTTIALTVTATANAPVANPGGPYTGTIGQPVTFNGSGSSGPSGQTLTYAWNFGDNTTGTGANPTHTYSAVGNYSVSVTVTDTSGASNTSPTTTATIVSEPVANAGGPYTGTVGEPITFNGSATTGPPGQALTYTWSFGDGATSTGVNPSHTYSAAGTFNVTLTVTDPVGGASSAPPTTATITATTTTTPTVSGFSPSSGPVGTVITVMGTNFAGQNGAGPQVTLTQQSGGSINAPVSTFTATSLSFVVPAGAATGPITVTVGSQSAASTGSLTITVSSSFTLGVTPGTGSLIPGQSSALAVSISSTNGFSGTAALSVSGLPSGVTASFQPTAIAIGQTAVLTLSAPASQAAATSTLTITGTATIQGQSITQSATSSLQVTGVTTSFLGRTVVDDAQQEPIAGVTVKFLSVDNKGNPTVCSGQTVSDGAGNFQFTNLPIGCTGPQLISYNGLTATSPAGTYAGVNLYYTLVSGQAVASPVLIHLPRIDNAETVQVQQNAPNDQVFYFQTIPGLKVTVYAGTTFKLDDGSIPTPFPLVAIEIPIDRLPDTMPTTGMLTPFIVAFQPANATASQPVSVNFPNPLGMSPGTLATFMTLDPLRGSMVPYGMGAVSNDGTEFIAGPDPNHPANCLQNGVPCHGYGLTNFDWHGPAPMPPSSIGPSQDGPGGPGSGGPSDCPGGPSGQAPNAGDPVDLSSGIVSYTTTDLWITCGRGSIAINRYYRTLTTNPGPFGIGTALSYSYSLNTLAYDRGGATITLAIPDGNQFTMSQAPNGTFVNTTVPSLIGAVLTANGPSGPYTLRWANGTVYQFTVFTSLGYAGAFLTSITDLNGNTTTLTLNPNNPLQIQTITDSVGRSLTLTYDGSSRITQVTDPIGRTVKYVYNPQGYLQTFIDANGGMTNYAYDSANNLATITDPRGIMTEKNTYNTGYDNRVIQQVAADGGIYQFAYAQLCGAVTLAPVLDEVPTQIAGCVPADPVQQTLVTDPLGNQTLYRFNPQGFLVSATDPSGQTRTLTRDPVHNNLVSSYTGAGVCPVCGNVAAGSVSFTFDQFGNTLTRTDALGNTTTFGYDTRFNKVSSITDPLTHTTSVVYDGKGNPTSITDANTNATQLAYDSFGDLIQITDPIGTKTAVGYDAYGNISSVTDALGHTSNLIYDAVSRLTRVVDALGRNSTAAYDPLNRVSSETDARGNTTKFTYDPIGDLLTFTDARGNQTKYSYYPAGQLQTRISPLNKTQSYAYDKDSNLIQYIDRRGQTSTFTYDSLNRVVQETFIDSTVTASYDANSRLVSVNDSAGGVFGFAYDGAGRLLTQDEPTGVVNYTRDALGRVATRQVAGQTAVQYNYDPAGNMLSAATPAVGVTYQYDPRNLPQSLTRTNGVVSNFIFDPLYRVQSIIHSNGAAALNTLSYTYDAVGNRSLAGNDISQALITQSASATVDNGNELLTNGGTTYTYDANGNRLTETSASGALTYTWDGRNRLSSIKNSNGDTATLQYDFGRNLLGVTQTAGAATTTQSFVVDSLTNVVALTGPSGSAMSVLTGRSLDSHYASVDASGDIAFGIKDTLGSITGITDGSGNLTAKFDYEPFGQTTGTAESSYPFAYTGRVPVLGNIVYYRNRFYDAGTGRFLSEDPIGLLGGVNEYAYVGNSPINRLDPRGLCGQSKDNPWLATFAFVEGTFNQDPAVSGVFGGFGLWKDIQDGLNGNPWGWVNTGVDIAGLVLPVLFPETEVINVFRSGDFLAKALGTGQWYFNTIQPLIQTAPPSACASGASRSAHGCL